MVCWNSSSSMKYFLFKCLKDHFPQSLFYFSPSRLQQELVVNKIICHMNWRQSLTNVSHGLFTMLAAKLNPPLLFHKPKWTVLLRLWKSDTFQSTGPNRDLQAMLWATAWCPLSWVLIITVLFVLAITFGRRFAFLRLKITTTAVFEWFECELWALHCISV